MKKKVFFILATLCVSSGFVCSGCHGSKSEQHNEEQDSLEQVSKKAYKDLLFGMSLSEVKDLGYLEDDRPISHVNFEDVDENGKMIDRDEVNGIKSYICNYKTIGDYKFDFVSLGFAKDTLVQVEFQKSFDLLSSLSIAYNDLRTILDSNFGNPIYENIPNFMNPADCDILKYRIGTKEVVLSFDIEEEAAMMGFSNCYYYRISIIDTPNYNKATSDSNKTSDI